MSDPNRVSDCLFCRIATGEIPATVLYETNEAMVIADIHPQAPIHALAIPRQHISSIAEATVKHAQLLAGVFTAANSFARARGLEESGYRLVINHGQDAGQTVRHLHVHILGGAPMGWPPFPRQDGQ